MTVVYTACLLIGLIAPMVLAIRVAGLMIFSAASISAIGAYTYALIVVHSLGPPYLALVIATMSAAVFGRIIGAATAHIGNEAFGVAQLCISVIVSQLLVNLDSVTRGPLGIPGIVGLGNMFGLADSLSSRTIILSIFAVVSSGFCYLVARSTWGIALRASDSDPKLLSSFGTNPKSTRISVLVATSAVLGFGGALFSASYRYIDPGSFTLSIAVAWFTMALLGVGPFWLRPTVGVAIFVSIQEGLKVIGIPDLYVGWGRQAIFGLTLCWVVILGQRDVVFRLAKRGEDNLSNCL